MGRAVRKTLVVLCACALIASVLAAGGLLYLYHRPSWVKALAEDALSGLTGTAFSIEQISYSLRPLRIGLRGIHATGRSDRGVGRLEVPSCEARMALEGPFGSRTLAIEKLTVDGFSAQLFLPLRLPSVVSEPGVGGFLAIGKHLASFLLFRDTRLKSAEVSRGSLRVLSGQGQAEVTAVEAALHHDGSLEMRCAAQVRTPEGAVLFDSPRLHVGTEKALSSGGTAVKARFTADEAVVRYEGGALSGVRVQSPIQWDRSTGAVLFDPLVLSAQEAAFPGAHAQELSLGPLRLECAGAAHYLRRELTLSRFVFSAGEARTAQGNARIGFGQGATVHVVVTDGMVSSEQLLAALGARPEGFDLRVSGPVNFQGEVTGAEEEASWTWVYDVQARMARNRFRLAAGGLETAGKLDLALEAKGRYPEVNVTARVSGDETNVQWKGIACRTASFGCTVMGSHPVYSIEEVAIMLPAVEVSAAGRQLGMRDVALGPGRGTVHLEERSVDLPDLPLFWSTLGDVRISARRKGRAQTIGVRGKDTRLVETALAMGVLPEGWHASGASSFEATGTLHDDGRASFTGRVQLPSFGFDNQEGSRAGEDILATVHWDGAFLPDSRKVSLKSSVDLARGGLLYDRFFVDLKKHPMSLRCEGSYDTEAGSLTLTGLALDLKDMLGLKLEGTLSPGRTERPAHLLATVPEIPLQNAYRLLVLEPYGAAKPIVPLLNPRGTVAARLEITRSPEGMAVKGNALWEKGSLAYKDTLLAENVRLDLPIWYATGRQAGDDRVPTGSLVVGKVLAGPLTGQTLRFPLSASANTLSIPSPVTVKLEGGRVAVGPVTWKGVWSSTPLIEASCAIEEVDVSSFLPGVLSKTIEGRIVGDLERVRCEGDTCTARGNVQARILGGTVVLSDLGVSAAFSRAPVFGFSARFRDIDLAALTGGTSFGEVQGVMEGHALNVEIADGQPQGFDLLLETVERKGKPQRISLKAVDSIAQIGGGNTPFVGIAGGFADLFREFPYKKIGIRASLENDLFRINGTIQEDGVEYLVKRGGFSGVNVVNQNPDNRISFKDMVKRIKRITDSKTGPVIR